MTGEWWYRPAAGPFGLACSNWGCRKNKEVREETWGSGFCMVSGPPDTLPCLQLTASPLRALLFCCRWLDKEHGIEVDLLPDTDGDGIGDDGAGGRTLVDYTVTTHTSDIRWVTWGDRVCAGCALGVLGSLGERTHVLLWVQQKPIVCDNAAVCAKAGCSVLRSCWC
jgi:hypothetical protein